MYKNSPLNPTSSSYLWLERKLLTSTFEAPKDGTNNHLPLKNSWFKTFNEQRLKKLLYLLSSQFFILLNLQLLPSKAVWWSPQGLEKVSVLSICLFPPWAGKKLIFSNTKKKKEKNTRAQRWLNLVYSQRTNAMHKWNSVFKKCEMPTGRWFSQPFKGKGSMEANCMPLDKLFHPIHAVLLVDIPNLTLASSMKKTRSLVLRCLHSVMQKHWSYSLEIF